MKVSFDMYRDNKDPPEVKLGPIIGVTKLTGAAEGAGTVGVLSTGLSLGACPVL